LIFIIIIIIIIMENLPGAMLNARIDEINDMQYS